MKKPFKITLISLGGAAALMLVFMLCAWFEVPDRLHVLWHRTFPHPDDYVRTEAIPALRGEILDREGNVLVRNRERHDIYMDCCVVEDPDQWLSGSRALADGLAGLVPSRTADEWYDYFQQARATGNRYIPIVRDAGWPLRDSLRQLPLFCESRYKGGYISELVLVRDYPFGELARTVLGSVGPGNTRTGLEKTYDEVLSGRNGQKEVQYGRRRGQLQHWEIGRTESEDGLDVQTTLDMRLQAAADATLRMLIKDFPKSESALLAVMEVETGAVRAMAELGTGIGEDEWTATLDTLARCSAWANGGTTVPPCLVSRIGNKQEQDRIVPEEPNSSRIIADSLADALCKGKPLANNTFVGFLPPEEPNYSIIYVLYPTKP